jgi:hypothetical protein
LVLNKFMKYVGIHPQKGCPFYCSIKKSYAREI